MSEKIQSIMTRHPSTVFVAESLQNAYQKMRTLKVRHLPVINGSGKLVGIISDRDFQRVMNRERVSETEETFTFDSREIVEDIMSWPVMTIPEGTSIRSAARLMVKDKLSALVITSVDQHPMGIVTTDDFLNYLVESGDQHFERPVLFGLETRM
ncbi:MAG: CBS domain-containing protein [Bacteriovoracaceae bacterium]|nr:CBS domain-containing protein [Bacteriovoracaceae bacterium]